VKRKLLVGVALVGLAAGLSAHDHKQTLLSYVGENPSTGDQWMRPAVAPLVEVHVMEGHKPTLDHRSIMCSWSTRDKQQLLADGTTLTSRVGVFLCEDGTVLEMTNVYFGEAK
jgi:hypothetical protein